MKLKEHLKNNWILYSMLAVALIGFLDATYLTVNHYSGATLRCGSYGGCDIVAGSKYSTVFGIPVALLGALYYVTIILAIVSVFDNKNKYAKMVLMYLPLIGLACSAWFVYAQIYLIGLICYYCMVSAVTSLLLSILGPIIYRKNEK